MSWFGNLVWSNSPVPPTPEDELYVAIWFGVAIVVGVVLAAVVVR